MNVTEAMQIDQANGNTYSKDTIYKDMKNYKIAYEPIEHCTPEEVQKSKVDDMHGYQEIIYHVIFDVKTDFTWKARFVANGSKTEVPFSLTYLSIMPRDSVRLEFLITSLNDLDVMSCYIGISYLNSSCKYKILFEAVA